MNIKYEMEIKEEPFESLHRDEYLPHGNDLASYNSGYDVKIVKTEPEDSDCLDLRSEDSLKCEEVNIKLAADQENQNDFNEASIKNQSELEQAIVDNFIKVKIIDLNYIQNFKVEINEPETKIDHKENTGVEISKTHNHRNKSYEDEKILYRELERSDYPKVVVEKLKVNPKKIVNKIFEASLCSSTLQRDNSSKNRNAKEESYKNGLGQKSKKLFQRPVRDYRSKPERTLKVHVIAHPNTKLFGCSECDYRSNDKRNLKRHLLTHMNKMFKCSECDFQCRHPRYIKRHSLTHSDAKLFKCSECGYGCNQKIDLKFHALTHSNSKLFKCFECSYETNRKVHLKGHLLTHSDLKLFECAECDYKGNNKRDFKNHQLTHSNTKTFKCSECGYGGNRKSDYQRHLLKHMQTKLLKCSECSYACNRKDQLKGHLLKHSLTVN